MEDASIFIAEILLPFSPGRTPSFIRSQDSIANGALVIARFSLAIGTRPVGPTGRPITGFKIQIKIFILILP